jgi:hypothetical protein
MMMRRDGDVPDARRKPGSSKPRARSGDADLLFDYTGVGPVDVKGLSLLLTARLLPEQRDRKVWVRGLPYAAWRFLQAGGLDHLFRLFPISVEPAN